MTFDSSVFLIFFGIVYAAWMVVRNSNRAARNGLLLVASYIFYGYWSPPFVTLLLISTFVDFYLAKAIHHASDKARRKQLLTVSVLINLGILGFFKYFNFFIDSVFMFVPEGSVIRPTLEVVLPVGISFYTFQSMSYSIDVYRNKLKPSDSLIDFALYVAFFPQLVAGPIERATHMLPQFAKEPQVNASRTLEGLDLCIRGFFKKIVIADNLAPLVNLIFGDVDSASSAGLWIGTYAFALQIYCDFSAYSDIARGISKLLGFELMVNFDAPYRSLNVSEFWHRWHISLSTWLRDYLYIPLGGNKGSKIFQVRNLFLVMGLGGLWHGASWNFVMWGLYHGVLLAVYHISLPLLTTLTAGFNKPAQHVFKFASWFLTFHLICISWVLFRVKDVSDIGTSLYKMLVTPVSNFLEVGFDFVPNAGPGEQAFYVLLIVGAMIAQHRYFDGKLNVHSHAIIRGARSAVALSLIFILYPSVKEQFIYFQF